MTQEEDIRRAVEVLRKGGVILYPTDTVWGIGCDATNAELIDCCDKPTTLVLDGAVNLAPNLVADDGSIGIRITQEPFSKELCYRFQKALVSTSANISGQPAAQNYRDIAPELLEAVDYVCWSRRQEHKPHTPSSIIRLRQDGQVEIIRK